jgi:hypothetical protein
VWADRDGGMPYVIRGMFHLNCPRPLKNVPKASENFHEALKVRAMPTEQGVHRARRWIDWGERLRRDGMQEGVAGTLMETLASSNAVVASS